MWLCSVVLAHIHAVVHGRHLAADHAVVRHGAVRRLDAVQKLDVVPVRSRDAVQAENRVKRTMHMPIASTRVAHVLRRLTTTISSDLSAVSLSLDVSGGT